MDFSAASQRDEEVDDDAESAAAADQEPSPHLQVEEDAGDEVIENNAAIDGGAPNEQPTRRTSDIPAEHTQAGLFLPAQQADQLQKAMEHAKSFFLPRKEQKLLDE